MNENNPTKSSYKTLSHTVSTTILMKTKTRSKTPHSNSSTRTGRNTIYQRQLPSQQKFSSLRDPSHNDIHSTPMKERLNQSAILHNSSSKALKKTRVINQTPVAFFRCVPKSCTSIFKSTAIPLSQKGSETSAIVLKLFSEYFPKDQIQDFSSQSSKFVRLKIFPVISSKKKVMNLIPNDSNAHKIKTPEEYLKCAYNPVIKFQKKIQVKHLTAIAKEIAVNYSKDFSLCRKENFSQKYRLYPGILNLENECIDKEILRRMMNKNQKLKLEINKILKKRTIDMTLSRKKKMLHQFKIIMIRAAIHFKRLHISLEDFYCRDYDSITSFDFKGRGSHQLIKAIKIRSIKEIYEIIEGNTFLIHDFDNVKRYRLI